MMTLSPDAPIHNTFGAETSLRRKFHIETKIRHILNPDKSPGILLRLMQRGEWYLLLRRSSLVVYKRLDVCLSSLPRNATVLIQALSRDDGI